MYLLQITNTWMVGKNLYIACKVSTRTKSNSVLPFVVSFLFLSQLLIYLKGREKKAAPLSFRILHFIKIYNFMSMTEWVTFKVTFRGNTLLKKTLMLYFLNLIFTYFQHTHSKISHVHFCIRKKGLSLFTIFYICLI